MRFLSLLSSVVLVVASGCGSRTDLAIAGSGSGASSRSDGGPEGASTSSSGSTTVATSTAGIFTSPRPIAPLSTSRVTSRTPTFRWALPEGVTDATVDLCADRACTRPIAASAHVTGTSYAPARELPPGVVFWRLHPSTSTTLTSATWQLTVGARSAPVDTSWGTTFDMNGDGYADVVVGGGDAVSYTQTAYVYPGSASGVATQPLLTLAVPDGKNDFVIGGSVANAGDVNGDGFADLVVATSSEFFAYVFLGSAAGLAATPSEMLADPRQTQGAQYEDSVRAASAGDVNGDGYADVLVGSVDNRTPSDGHAYLYLGGPEGLASAPSTTLAAAGSVSFGGFVASAGDLNGDGYGDVVVEANDSAGAATLYVYMGGPAGLVSSPAAMLNLALDGMYTPSIAAAGDVNGDGYADLVVGISGTGEGDQGTVSLYLGSSTGLATTPVMTLTPDNDVLGIATAGDVNGDGYSDLEVGAWNVESSFLYLGGPAGLAEAPVTTLPPPPGSQFDLNFTSAGDVNGDGNADVLVGAPGEGTGGGAAYVYLGSAAGLMATPAATLSNRVETDGAFGDSVAGATN